MWFAGAVTKKWTHVFWDMGGTMIDTYPGLDRALAGVIRRAGYHVELEDVSRLTRISTGEAISQLSQAHGIPVDEFRTAEAALKQRWRKTPPPVMAHLNDVMAAVPGLNLVVTHRDRDSAESLLEALGIKVDDMISTSDGCARKPDPAMYVTLVERHGLDPDDCVGVGDRPLDAEAAQAAGMSAVMVKTPGIPLEHQADLQVTDLDELIPLLARQDS